MNRRTLLILAAFHQALLSPPARGEPVPVVSVTSTTAISYGMQHECWPELITRGEHFREERERIRSQTPWYVPYVVPAAGVLLGSSAGSQFGRGDATTAMTVVGGVLGAIFGPGAVVGAWMGGTVADSIAEDLGAAGRLREAAAVAGALGGAMLGKSLFDQMLASVSPYHADAMKDPPEKPDSLMQVRRCAEQPQPRRESSAFVVVYRYESERRAATLPFDPGDAVLVDGEGAVDLAAYRNGVPRP